MNKTTTGLIQNTYEQMGIDRKTNTAIYAARLAITHDWNQNRIDSEHLWANGHQQKWEKNQPEQQNQSYIIERIPSDNSTTTWRTQIERRVGMACSYISWNRRDLKAEKVQI
jgi:hypothetical protein